MQREDSNGITVQVKCDLRGCCHGRCYRAKGHAGVLIDHQQACARKSSQRGDIDCDVERNPGTIVVGCRAVYRVICDHDHYTAITGRVSKPALSDDVNWRTRDPAVGGNA